MVHKMLNACRVLLTRARSGMVICVPEGNGNITPTGFWEDSTRLPDYYDGTYQYLKSLGIEEHEDGSPHSSKGIAVQIQDWERIKAYGTYKD